MATEHLKQATQDAADAVMSAKEAVVDAKDAVLATKDDVVEGASEHGRTIDTMQASLEARADEREQAARRAEH